MVRRCAGASHEHIVPFCYQLGNAFLFPGVGPCIASNIYSRCFGWGVTCKDKGCHNWRQEGTLESRIDDFEPNVTAPEPGSRHIVRSSLRGMVTELERISSGDGSEERYILRCRPASATPEVIFGVGWIGFRYREAQWSFVKHGQKAD